MKSAFSHPVISAVMASMAKIATNMGASLTRDLAVTCGFSGVLYELTAKSDQEALEKKMAAIQDTKNTLIESKNYLSTPARSLTESNGALEVIYEGAYPFDLNSIFVIKLLPREIVPNTPNCLAGARSVHSCKAIARLADNRAKYLTDAVPRGADVFRSDYVQRVSHSDNCMSEYTYSWILDHCSQHARDPRPSVLELSKGLR